MRTTRLIFCFAIAVVALFASCKRTPTTPGVIIPAPHRVYFVDFVQLEPSTVSKLSSVAWTILTTTSSYVGSQNIVAGDPITIAFPTTADVLAFDLKGFDSSDRLRAEGVLHHDEIAASSEAAPAHMLFPLFDEFQAYSASAGPNLLFFQGYVDTSGGIVIIGGGDYQFPAPSARSQVVRFDPLIGTTSQIGSLAIPRASFSTTPLLGGSFGITRQLIVGGGETSIEIWDRVAHTSTTLAATLSVVRYDPQILSFFSAGFWKYYILGGTSNTTVAGELFDSQANSISALTTQFKSNHNERFFRTGLPPTVVTFYQWFGAASVGANDGLVYQSNAASPSSAFTTAARLSRPAQGIHGINPVLFSSDALSSGGSCRDAFEVAGGGAPPAVAHYSWAEDICDPTVLTLDTDHLLVVGGTRSSAVDYRDTVKRFEFSSNSISDEMTIDGQAQRLVYARREAAVFRLPDGRIAVVGGYTSDIGVHPRMEIRVPSPP